MTDRLTTERLILRRWTDDDREPFADLNADAEVMRYFPNTLTRVESDALVDRIEQSFVLNHQPVIYPLMIVLYFFALNHLCLSNFAFESEKIDPFSTLPSSIIFINS